MSFKITDFKADQQGFKTVNYFGMILQVPAESRYLATDANGYIYAYSYSFNPQLGVKYWCGGCVESDVNYLGIATFEGDWKESLMEIENV
jgi:hypothetical protein